MTEEIAYYDEELAELTQEIERGLSGLSKGSQISRLDRVKELDGGMQRVRQALQAFKVEMRELQHSEMAEWDLRAREHHSALQKMQGELQFAKGEAERAGVGLRNVDDMSTGEVMHEASKVQGQSLQSIGRMKAQIADTMQIGADTAGKLKSQTEQLQSIDTDIMKVKSNLNRADLLIRAFVRRMATDKVVMIFMCLVFLGVVAIIIFKIVDPGGDDGVDEEAPDEVVGALDRRLLFPLIRDRH